MNVPTHAQRLALPFLACGLFACSNDDDPVRGEPLVIAAAQVREDALGNVRGMLESAWRTEKFLDEANTLNDVEHVVMDFSGDDATEDDGGTDEGDIDEPSGGLVLPLNEPDFDELKNDVEAQLERYVFRDDQIESQTATSIVYRINPMFVCDDNELDADDREECIKVFTALELRVAVSSFVSGDIDLRVLWGPDQHEVSLIEAHADVIAVSLHVGPAVDAVIAAVHAVDPESEAPVGLDARGTVRVALRKLGPEHLRASVEIVAPVAIEVTNDGETVALEGGVGEVALEVDNATQTAELEVDVRNIEVHGPKSLLEDEESCYDELGNYDESFCQQLEGTIEVGLARLAGIASLVDQDHRAVIEGIIAGPLTFKVDDDTVLELVVNDATSPFDISGTANDSTVSVQVDGAVDASLLLELGKAADVWPDLDGWLASDLLGLTLPMAKTIATVTGDGVIMNEGSMALSSRARPDLDQTIAPGQCMWEPPYVDDGESEESHPFDLESGPVCGG